ncbi:MAG: hypothetical protein ABI690_22655 [Chloroflexota bacterium]
MNSETNTYRHLVVWLGENALNWEREAWQKFRQSAANSEFEDFLEAQTRDEWEYIDTQLNAEGWEATPEGSGWMWRISGYQKLQSAE